MPPSYPFARTVSRDASPLPPASCSEAWMISSDAFLAGETLSRFYEAEHRAKGVDIRLGETVERILGSEGRASVATEAR